jgi:hypothetical protein
MYKSPLPEACVLKAGFMFRKVWSTVEVLYSFFARIISGDHNEGIVYVSVLLLYPNSGINGVPNSNSAVFSKEPLHEEPQG